MIFGQQFASMNAQFACHLDSVDARRSVSVWRRCVEKYGVESLLRLGRDGSPSWLSCCLLWLVVVGCDVVVRGFVMLLLCSSYDIF